jgi:hypothetical protein
MSRREVEICVYWLTIMVFLVTLAYKIGSIEGQKEGSTIAQLTVLADIKRQCESPFPLLLGDTFYSCKANGVVIR